ncbi:DUF5753 domain-containing protein [Phytohabitans sp. LJ34]|uniref:DUF5753 domain-containing protein n=1 Tax=Phytohabitans sp. LJ34 TaxID=3452217 RepID=UPI003F8B2904
MSAADHEPMSLRAKWLGVGLRELRERRRCGAGVAARELGIDTALLRAYEAGSKVVGPQRAARFLELYKVFDLDEQEQVLGLARDAWPEPDSPLADMEPSLVDLLWLEANAARIRCFSNALVPDPLRTERYADAVAQVEVPAARRPGVGFARRLDGPHEPDLHVLIAESALTRPVGRSDVNTEQLLYLAKLARTRMLTLRVLPNRAGYLPGMDTSFTVFDVPPYPAVATLRVPDDRWRHDDEDAASAFDTAFYRLRRQALDVRASLDLLTSLTEQHR